jgi:hypothetical protein
MAKRKIRMLILRKKKPDTSLLIAGIDAHMINVLSRHMDCFRRIEINGKFKISWRSYFKETKRN